VFFSALELKTTDYHTFGPVISFFICIGMNLLGIIVLIKIFHVNLTLKKKKTTEEEVESYKVFFEHYKDDCFEQQIFLALQIFRISLFYMVVAYLYNHPLVQAIINFLINISFVGYLIGRKPMKKLINFLQQFTMEIILLLFNLCVLILAIADKMNSNTRALRLNIGEIMLVINLIAPSVTTGFIVIKFLLILFETYTEYKQSKVQKLQNLNIRSIERSSVTQDKLQNNPDSSPLNQEIQNRLETENLGNGRPITPKKILHQRQRRLQYNLPSNRFINESSFFLFILC